MASVSADGPSIGTGRIVLHRHGPSAVFSELSAQYPLKLLSPRVAVDGVAALYVLSYGGGLVGGDDIQLNVDIGNDAVLMLLTQGSTKVFKTRPGSRASTRHSNPDMPTTQKMCVDVAGNGTVLLLPDPVTCFRSASYTQLQTFRLSSAGSAAILDWITSGRKSLGEEWAFTCYHSVNELWVDEKLVARDALLLEPPSADLTSSSSRTLKARLAPYTCYATLLLYGPRMREVIQDLSASYDKISVFKRSRPENLIWSLSPLGGVAGCIVRVAGLETEDVKQFLARALCRLETVVGQDLYSKAFL